MGPWCAASEIAPKPAEIPKDVHHGFAIQDKFWSPHKVINYGFLKDPTLGYPTAFQVARIRTAFDLFEEYTSLQFHNVGYLDGAYVDRVAYNFNDAAVRNEIPIRIQIGNTFQHQNTTWWGWSFIGTDSGPCPMHQEFRPHGVQEWATTYLGGQPYDLSAEWKDPCYEMAQMTLFHELGHVLGMNHEHDSDKSEVSGGQAITEYLVGTMVSDIMPYISPLCLSSTVR